MFKKKLLAMVMALGMAGAMAACGGSSGSTSTTAAAAGNSDTATTAAAAAAADDGETYTLIFSHENAESSLVHQLTLQFKEEVEAATNGHVIIDVYPNSQLGSKTDNWQGICDNTIQMVLGLGSHMDDRLSILNMPCLYSSVETCKEAMSPDSELYQKVEEISDEVGVKVLLEVPIGFRTLSTNVETKSYEDLAGQNIRVMEMQQYIKLWSAFGCNPTPVAFSELYLALQQGLVDAQDNPIGGIYASKFYEVQDYIMRITAFPFVSFIIINEDVYNGLPEEYQKVLVEFAEDYNAKSLEVTLATEDGYVDLMEKEGLTCLEFTPEIRDAMKAAAEPVWEQIKQDIGSESPDALRAAAEAAK